MSWLTELINFLWNDEFIVLKVVIRWKTKRLVVVNTMMHCGIELLVGDFYRHVAGWYGRLARVRFSSSKETVTN